MLRTLSYRVASGCTQAQKALIHMAPVMRLKAIEITEDKQKKQLTIEGKYLNPEETMGSKVLDLETNKSQEKFLRPCSFCELEKKNIYVQHTDVLVLRQFLTEDGQVLNKKITGLCKKQQRKLLVLVKQAKTCGLLMNLQPRLLDGSMPSTDTKSRPGYLKWNAYYDNYEEYIRKNKYI